MFWQVGGLIATRSSRLFTCCEAVIKRTLRMPAGASETPSSQPEHDCPAAQNVDCMAMRAPPIAWFFLAKLASVRLHAERTI